MSQRGFTTRNTIRDSVSVGKYFSEISKSRLLSAEEEAELGKRIANKDAKAREQLICGNLKFVVSIAKQYQGKGLGLADLISEGNIGLMIAAEKFDASRGFKFITFAVWWIRQSILRAIAEQSRTVRLPKSQILFMSRIAKFSSRFEQRHERPPGYHETAEAMGIESVQVADYLGKVDRILSIDAEIAPDCNLTLLDLIGIECREVEKILDQDVSVGIFEQALSLLLNAQERRVITCYFGLDKVYAMRLEEIAEEMRLTKERIRQIKDAALRKLRDGAMYLKSKIFD